MNTSRFWSKVDTLDGQATDEDCWLWIGGKNDKGYGYMKFFTVMKLAHRVAYELYRGKIPLGMLVCHKCDSTSCVNPSHLFLGTQSDNILDAYKKGRAGIYRHL